MRIYLILVISMAIAIGCAKKEEVTPTPAGEAIGISSTTGSDGPFKMMSPVEGVYKFVDDFNDNTIDPSHWIAFQVGYGPTVVETNQRLEITLPADSSDDSVMGLFEAGYLGVCRLRGDFDIQVDYELLNWPYANGVRVGLGPIWLYDLPLLRGPVERVSFGSWADFPDWPREVYLTHFDDGVQGITATSDLSGKLRLIRSGSTLSGFYFSSGKWVLIHSGPATTDDLYYTIAAWSHDYAFTDQEVKIAFDNFVVNAGELICPVLEVLIDIKPGSFPNSINLRSKGNVPVAILSNRTFDATTVDRSTVVFAGAPPLPIGGTPEDVNGDGLLDVVLHFSIQRLNLQPGDTKACLTGKTVSGQDFKGWDSIHIVK
jgi:hypothetical protein